MGKASCMLAQQQHNTEKLHYLIRINNKIIDSKENYLKCFTIFMKMHILYNNGVFQKDLGKFYNFIKNCIFNIDKPTSDESKLYEKITKIPVTNTDLNSDF